MLCDPIARNVHAAADPEPIVSAAFWRDGEPGYEVGTPAAVLDGMKTVFPD